MKQTKKNCFYGIILLTAMSCASDDVVTGGKSNSGVSFDVSVAQLQEQQGNTFRAPAITNTPMKGNGTQMYVRQTTVGSIDQHIEPKLETKGTKVDAISSFKLYSYKYSGSWASSYSSAMQVSNDVTLESSNNWKLTTPWANSNMAFFGVYDETNSATFSTNNGGELTYTVPSAVADQKDLLVAKNVDITEATNDSKVPMTFNHALTAVQFGIGSTMADGTITKIELQGIKNSGTYNFINNTWTTSSKTTTYTISNLNIDIASNKGSGGTKLFTGSNNDLLLLMPQTLGSEAKLVVSITEKGTPQTLSVSLTGGEWEAGHTVTYSLTTNSETGQYVFIVGDLDKSSVDENGGTVSSTIKSYYQDYYGTQTPVGWTATYSVDGGTTTSSPGNVVKSFTASGTGNSSCSLNIGEVEKIFISDPELNEHTRKLRTEAIKGTSDNPLNLAGTNGSETTANCYIVNAPGYYKIPIVYGNGLKNSISNTESIVNREPFVNHLGNAISKPYLNDNTNVNPTNAVIVWQDAYHLVNPSSLKISSDNKYLSFQVPQQYICQGNCVLAVCDADNTILWSWHIWVTDQDMTTVSSSNNGDTYNFMPVALGHCDPDTRKTQSHSIKVTLSQNNSDNTDQINISQIGTLNLGVSAPYYQWGRKDPLNPSDVSTKSWKPVYDNYYTDISTNIGYSPTPVELKVAIQNPHVSYAATANWSTNSSYELWHVGNAQVQVVYSKSSNPVKKSIFDPCPVSFKMPEPGAFNAFQAMAMTNNSCTFISDNYWFAYGRIMGGIIYGVGTNGYNWTAAPCSSSGGYGLLFESEIINHSNFCNRANGFPVRPVKE